MPALDWPRLQTLRYSQQGRGQRIFSLAFPTLFPLGEADWALPRLHAKGLKFFNWIQHLLRYHDGRFAQHDRFRYAVFNIWLRELSSARSRWVVNKHFGQPVTIDELRENLDNGLEHFLNSIVRCAGSIKGTRPFWKRRGRELSAFIDCLGMPVVFFTFSAADTQWDSLQRHMPDYWQWKHGSDEERYV
jgi:ATP-dependent DNA helicase PIF1